MNWKNININIQNIKQETGKAVLIAMPHNSNYDGYSFWHPAKLVRDGNHSYAISLGYTDDFTFNLKKYGKGRYNKHQVIAEQTISVKEFEKAFGVMSENIVAPKKDTESYLYVKEPEKIEKDVEVLEELKNDNGYREFVNYLESEERNKDV